MEVDKNPSPIISKHYSIEVGKRSELRELNSVKEAVKKAGKLIYTGYSVHKVDDPVYAYRSGEVLFIVDTKNLHAYSTNPEEITKRTSEFEEILGKIRLESELMPARLAETWRAGHAYYGIEADWVRILEENKNQISLDRLKKAFREAVEGLS